MEKETRLQSFWAWWGWGGQSQPGVTTHCPCSQGLAPTAHTKCFESFPRVKRNKNHIQGTKRLGVRSSRKVLSSRQGRDKKAQHKLLVFPTCPDIVSLGSSGLTALTPSPATTAGTAGGHSGSPAARLRDRPSLAALSTSIKLFKLLRLTVLNGVYLRRHFFLTIALKIQLKQECVSAGLSSRCSLIIVTISLCDGASGKVQGMVGFPVFRYFW